MHIIIENSLQKKSLKFVENSQKKLFKFEENPEWSKTTPENGKNSLKSEEKSKTKKKIESTQNTRLSAPRTHVW